MKKPLPFLAALLILATHLYSQSFNMSISGGYCFPLASEMHVNTITQFANPNYPNTYSTILQSVKPNSFGNGGNVALSMDWFSKNNIGFGLKVNALISTPVNYSASSTDANYNIYNYNFTDKAFSFQFIPHLNFKHDFKKVSPYIEMGMIIGVTQMNESFVATDNNGNTFSSDTKNYGNALLGFYSSLGVAFNVSKVVKLTLAVNCSAGSYSPSKYEVTSYSVNGVSQLGSMPEAIQQGSFVKQMNFTAQQYSNEPGTELKFAIPFSNVGVNAGICFVFPQKEKQGKYVSKDVHPF